MYGADETKGLTLKEQLEHEIERLRAQLARLRDDYETQCDTLHDVEQERDEARADRMRGNCCIISDGDKCTCGLCVREAEIKQLRRYMSNSTTPNSIVESCVNRLKQERDDARDDVQTLTQQRDHYLCELELLRRKVAHGCTDSFCTDCD